MAKFTKESIQRLRDAIDIVEVISRSIQLKKAGSSIKGLCPFHAEKTPSFHVQRSSKQYHCFGCGAHGDSLSFLMKHEGMSFTQALLFLSERFQVPLEEEFSGVISSRDEVKRARLKLLLEKANSFFHAMLLYNEEALLARSYLSQRACTLSEVRAFLLGYAPLAHKKEISFLQRYLLFHGFTEEEMVQAGLITYGKNGKIHDFFAGRIIFPIHDQSGSIIGFSARKIEESTYGGKYINTPETPLFKKSRLFFGLFYSKRRMVKERHVILVEGQLDALRLIYSGFDYTVATLGTAFGEFHCDILKTLGIEQVYIAFDSDEAGKQSAIKAGNLLMKRGFSTFHVDMKGMKDPDAFIVEKGRSEFLQAVVSSIDHVHFSLHQAQRGVDWSLASEREKSLRLLVQEIQGWQNPLLIHESIHQLARLCNLPIEFLQETGDEQGKKLLPRSLISSSFIPPIVQKNIQDISGNRESIDSDTELELDLLRWMLMIPGDEVLFQKKIQSILIEEDFSTKVGLDLFTSYIKLQGSPSQPMSFLDFAGELDSCKMYENYIQYMVQKPPLRPEKLYQHIYEAIRKLKERRWLMQREAIRKKIEESVSLEDGEQMKLLEEFSLLKAPHLPTLEELQKK